MKKETFLSVLVMIIVACAAVAASAGIFSGGGPGPYLYESIRGEMVEIFGKGLYRHMSAEVAPQGIAQDYVTLFLALPLLVISWYYQRKNSLMWKFLFAGTLSYFFVTYLFYLMMAMYNPFFIVYVLLLASSFIALLLTLFSFDVHKLPHQFNRSLPVSWIGGFLLFNCFAIGVMWLGVIIPPLLDGSFIPPQTEHYTTLVVQGLDLGLLLPLGILSAVLFIRKHPLGYLSAPVYLVFLSILMTALIAKIVAMGLHGFAIMPAIIVIPVFAGGALICSFIIFRSIKVAE